LSSTVNKAGPRLVIYGHIGFDVSQRGGICETAVGGAAYYAAAGASVIGCSTGVVSVIGSDFPQIAMDLLGVDVRGVLKKNGSSSVFTQAYDENHEVSAFDGQLNVSKSLVPELIPDVYKFAQVFFVTSAPPSKQREVLDWLVTENVVTTIAIDTHIAYSNEFRDVLNEYRKHISILFANTAEFAFFNDMLGDMDLVVKRGAAGASLREKNKWSDVPAPPTEKVCSTTGAGDILAGACLAAVAEGKSLSDAVACGVNLATFSVTLPGVEHVLGSGKRAGFN
jgi:sugar/nucleoside kinase (ribokinase family)